MNHSERRAAKKSVEKLPLFPAPYPGESFYSILCRYHIRSGNISDWHTVNQLFGYNCSLGSTLLSPYHLETANHWFFPGTPFGMEDLLQRHTAFPLYALTTDKYGISRVRNMLYGKIESTPYPRWIQTHLIHPSGFLRYCPECAATQKTLYGESYWQILPQLDGVEYCPVHKIRIRNSPVPVKNIRHRFYPASESLEVMTATVQGTEKSEWDSLFEEEREFFIKLASGINWLFQNGKYDKGNKNLYEAYGRVLGITDNRYCLTVSGQEIRSAITPSGGKRKRYLMNYLNQKILLNPGYDVVFLCCLSFCAHVMIMNITCGDPKTFFSM